MNELISIIIPIYNASNYLDELFESIENQTYKEYEVILINDGSVDNSEEKCINYQKRDNRVKYFYKENSGISDTRNFGIKKSNGKYICFIDSDDILDKNYLQDFMQNITDGQMVCCDKFDFFNKNELSDKRNEDLTIINELQDKHKYEVLYSTYCGYIWNKIFIRDIITKNKLEFDKSIHMMEDMVFVFKYLEYIEKIVCINKKNYNYRQNHNSASKNLKNEKWFSIFQAYDTISKDIDKCSKDFKSKYLFMYNYHILYAKYRLRYIKKSNNYQKIKDMVNENYDSIKQTYRNFTLKQRIKIFIYKYFNYLAFKLREEIK